LRLLFDQNLSFKLTRLLADVYPDSVHVRELGLVEADDLTIWRYAAEHGLVIVSKDSDFHGLSLLHGHPPKTVWLRVGNAPTPAIAKLLRVHHATMRRFHEDPDAALLALA
jgi:predicted nuclease of predicted toxin-antitoxin system